MEKLKFSDVFDDITRQGTKIQANQYLVCGKYQIIDQSQNDIAGYTNQEEGLFTDIPAIVFGDHTRVIKYVDKPCFLGADGVKLLRAKDSKANYKYLYYVLTNARIPDTGYNRHFKWLKEINIPLYDEETQNNIVKELEKITNLIDKQKKQLEKLDELVKSRFVEMFGNGNYPMVKAESVCEFITKGTTPPTGEIYAEFDDNKVPYLKVYNLSFDGSLLFDSEPQYINKEIHNGKLSRSKVYPNDVLMNIVGPPLGKFSLVTAEYPEWNINQAISIFRAKKDVLPRFLLSALMQPTVLKPFLKQAVGVRQLNISLEQCRNLQFPLPPIERQNEFVNFAEQTDKSKLEVQKSLEKLELLKKALMQKYFG